MSFLKHSCVCSLLIMALFVLAGTSHQTGNSASAASQGHGKAGKCGGSISGDANRKIQDLTRQFSAKTFGIFNQLGELQDKQKSDDPREAIKKKCDRLVPISNNCWMCCDTGEIFCTRAAH